METPILQDDKPQEIIITEDDQTGDWGWLVWYKGERYGDVEENNIPTTPKEKMRLATDKWNHYKKKLDKNL